MIRDKYKANIVAEYDFRKGTFVDQGAGGKDLTASGVYFRNSEKGRVLKFDGSAAYCSSAALAIGNEFTVISLVRPRTLDASDNVIFANGASGLFQFDFNNGNQIRVYSDGLSPSSAEKYITPSDYIDKWNIVGMTRSGTTTKMFGKDGLPGATTQTGTQTNTFELMGKRSANDKYWNGDMAYHLILNVGLTDAEMAQIYEELLTSQPFTVVDYKSNGNYRSLCTDGDMNKTGTLDWDVLGDGTIEKVIDAEKGKVLAVNGDTSAQSYARQYNCEVGKYYRMRGWIKTDGTARARVQVGSNWVSGAATYSDWTYVEGDAALAVNTYLLLGNMDSSGVVWYKDIKIFECESDGTPKYTETYIADGKGWNESVVAQTGFIENTGFRIDSGTFKVVDRDGFRKDIECVTAGIISIPSTMAYGTFEFDVYKDLDANDIEVNFIASLVGARTATSLYAYLFRYSSTERFVIGETTNGSYTDKMFTAASSYPIQTRLRIRITRGTTGIFTSYCSCTDGAEFTQWTPVTGTNPFTDTTTTSSAFIVASLMAGDKIGGFKFIPYIK